MEQAITGYENKMSTIKAETLVYNQNKAEEQKTEKSQMVGLNNETAAKCHQHLMALKEIREQERKLEGKLNVE